MRRELKSFISINIFYPLLMIIYLQNYVVTLSPRKGNEYKAKIEYEDWPIEKPRNLSNYIKPKMETAILKPRWNCNISKTFINIIMISNPENINRRNNIRVSTDMRQKFDYINIVTTFFMGLSKNSIINENIKQESRKFKDIIQENFYDSFYNSTIRVGMILKWIKKNCINKNVKYIMIANDDVYINIINLIQSILSHENNRAGESLLMGRLREWEQPVKDPSDPWYIPDYEYNDRYYPFYFDSSLGYVMSTSIAKKLYEISLTETFIHFGDIFFTGICARKAGLILVHNANFTKDCSTKFKECSSVITCLNGCKKN